MKYYIWLNDWLSLYIKPVVKIRTYTKYQLIVNKHIAPALGFYEMEQITPQILQTFVVNLTHTLSGNYVNNIITLLQKSLKEAVNQGISRTQFSDKIIRPKVSSKKIECFTLSEQHRIEQAVLSDKRRKMYGIVICLYTGLRIGELLALKWCDVNIQKGLLSVNRSCHYGKTEGGIYGRIEEEPKTAFSVRVIPIPKQLMPYIKELKRQSDCDYVISQSARPVPVRSYQNSFELLLKKLRIPHRGFHSLRHTFATRALECGMDVKTLSEILGHKNAEITLNRYVHSLLEHKTEMMNKLGKMLTCINSKTR